MKKIISIIMIAATVLFAGCGSSNTENTTIDIDLTEMSSTMIYSEVLNMMTTPDDYIGKTIKMAGNFSIYEDPESGNIYYACVIQDATACCSQGIEFKLKGDYKYPDDYPELGTEIAVTGVFHTYNEGEYTYCELENAEMTVA